MAPKRKAPTDEAATSRAVDVKVKKVADVATSAATIDLKKRRWRLGEVHPEGACFVPLANQLAARVPSPKKVIPDPRANERVLFVDTVHRGLGFPLHNFVHGLLYAYVVQIHGFAPNGILHIAVFMTLCECFLGVHPS